MTGKLAKARGDAYQARACANRQRRKTAELARERNRLLQKLDQAAATLRLIRGWADADRTLRPDSSTDAKPIIRKCDETLKVLER